MITIISAFGADLEDTPQGQNVTETGWRANTDTGARTPQNLVLSSTQQSGNPDCVWKFEPVSNAISIRRGRISFCIFLCNTILLVLSDHRYICANNLGAPAEELSVLAVWLWTDDHGQQRNSRSWH